MGKGGVDRAKKGKKDAQKKKVGSLGANRNKTMWQWLSP